MNRRHADDSLEVATPPDPALLAVAAALQASGASFDSIRRAIGGEIGFAELGLPLVRVGGQLLTMSEQNARKLRRLLKSARISFVA